MLGGRSTTRVRVVVGVNAALRATTIVNSYGIERDPITIANVEFAVNRDGP